MKGKEGGLDMRVDKNGNTFIKSEAQFTFELEGESYLDATTLSRILDNTVQVVNEVVQGDKDTFVNLKITKFSTGSFDIDFQAIAEQIENIITDPKTVAAGIVSAVVGAFEIVKHLKGEKPKKIIAKGDNTQITNTDGDTLTVDNSIANKFFDNAEIENAVVNIVTVVRDDTERPGFKIKSKTNVNNDKVIEYKRSDFEVISPVVEKMIDEEQEVLVNEVDAVLVIRKPDLVGDSKWGFIYNTYIDAAIEDKDWIENVREKNIKFGKNMRLPVKLRIETKLTKDGALTNDTTYTITKVTGDIIEVGADNQISIEY